MRETTITIYPAMIRHYKNLKDLGAVINRGQSTVIKRLRSDFTEREKTMIRADLERKGIDTTDIFKKGEI